MTSYRQMRRQARHVRRAGLQPIMVINNDGQFPSPVAAVITRYAWRYRSELAPIGASCAVLVLGWWLHLAHPHWWPYLVLTVAVAAWALITFGGRFGLPWRAERI